MLSGEWVRADLKILQAMRKPARRTKARKVESRLSCRTVHLRNPLSAIRRTAPRGFEPSDRPSDAGTPAFPLGFPSPAANSSECRPESPAVATPPESPSHHAPHPHIPPSAASAPAPSRSSSPAGPPAPPPTDDNRAHPQAPPRRSIEARLDSPERALSSLSASYAHWSLPLPPRTLRSSARGLPVLALGGSRGAMKAHCSSVSPRNPIGLPLRNRLSGESVYYNRTLEF
jgi:hypothetical protein